jgi:hypothetical protein
LRAPLPFRATLDSVLARAGRPGPRDRGVEDNAPSNEDNLDPASFEISLELKASSSTARVLGAGVQRMQITRTRDSESPTHLRTLC